MMLLNKLHNPFKLVTNTISRKTVEKVLRRVRKAIKKTISCCRPKRQSGTFERKNRLVSKLIMCSEVTPALDTLPAHDLTQTVTPCVLEK